MYPPPVLVEWTKWLAALVPVLAGLAGVLGWILGYRRALQEIRRSNLVNRYEKLYAPIYGLFVNLHIVIAYTTLAPYWQQRVKNAKKLFRDGYFLHSIKALFDVRKTKETAEFEYNGYFPMEDILKILRGNEAYADRKLLELIHHAVGSRYENPEIDGLLTDEELELYSHIYENYEKLQKKFAP